MKGAVQLLRRPGQVLELSFALVGLYVVGVYEALRRQLFSTETTVPLELGLSARTFCLADDHFAIFNHGSCCGVPTHPDSSCC